jgi:hypothetical protein
LPRRKQQVTQARSKVLRETERDPFEDAADDEEDEPAQSSSKATPKPQGEIRPPTSPSTVNPGSFSAFQSKTKKPKKEKKDDKKKRKAFNLEEEKPKMKTAIAESSVASTNLLNALQLINREREQVSENADAARHFESCKMLRRHILRYVSRISNQHITSIYVSNADPARRI